MLLQTLAFRWFIVWRPPKTGKTSEERESVPSGQRGFDRCCVTEQVYKRVYLVSKQHEQRGAEHKSLCCKWEFLRNASAAPDPAVLRRRTGFLWSTSSGKPTNMIEITCEHTAGNEWCENQFHNTETPDSEKHRSTI